MHLSLEGLTLHVADVERSREFYQRLPGAVLVGHRPGQFALLQIGKARLGLLARRFLPEGAPGFHLELSTSLAGVDELYEEVRSAGLTPDAPPTDRAWGERTFHVTDPDGNELEFDSRLGESDQA
jgi:lactoylglutathione lyase